MSVNENTLEKVIIFVNGIPLVLFELKNIANQDTTIENAYKHGYSDVIPLQCIQCDQ